MRMKIFRGRSLIVAVLGCVAALVLGGTAVADVMFDFSPNTTGVKRFYTVIDAKHSGLTLNMPGANTANGTQLIQWDGGRTFMNSHWEQINVGPNQDVYRNRWSRQCMDVDSRDVGAPVVQRHCDGTVSQKWSRDHSLDPTHGAITNVWSGLDLNVSGASTELGAKLIQWPRTPGATNALFRITSFNDLHVVE